MFEAWDDDQNNTLTSVSQNQSTLLDIEEKPKTNAGKKCNTSEMTDGVMKFFFQQQSQDPKAKEKAEAEALKALIGIKSEASGDDSSRYDQKAKLGKAEVDMEEMLQILKEIQKNQSRIESRLDKLSASVEHNQKESKNATKDVLVNQVKQEMKNQVVPAVNKLFKPIGDNLNKQVEQKLTSTDSVLKVSPYFLTFV